MTAAALSSRDWALAFHDHGYQVVVVPLRGKRPAISWKHHQTERIARAQGLAVELQVLLAEMVVGA